MSVYEKRFCVSLMDGMFSRYTDEVDEVLELAKRPDFTGVTEGYADFHEHNGGTMITRRTIGPVRILDLEYQQARKSVQIMIEGLR